MKNVVLIGGSGYSGTSLLVNTTDNSTSKTIIVSDDTTTEPVDFVIKNYRIDPQFVPSPKIRSKYKRNLKYRQLKTSHCKVK